MAERKKRKKEYITYGVGSLVFITLAGLTLYLIFKGFKGAGSLVVPGVFTGKTIAELLVILLLL